jgi:hypothetical protein
VLSSRIHVEWAVAAGSHLGVGNDPVYVKTRCFETFPFPAATEAQKARIRDLAEQLDAHRKRQLALHATLTMTDLYNVLEAVRAGEALTAKQRAIHEQGLVTVLRQLHDELDAAVAEAYGWQEPEHRCTGCAGSEGGAQASGPAALSIANPESSIVNRQSSGRSLDADAILERLVVLNRARAEEEARGLIRYLRPAYQAPSLGGRRSSAAVSDDSPGGRRVVAAACDTEADATARIPPTHQTDLALPPDAPVPDDDTLAWPKEMAGQIALVRDTIIRVAWQPSDGVKALSKHFAGVRAPTIQRHVDALVALGQV